MPTIDPARSLLLVIDVQSRLMPAIYEGPQAVQNVNRLITVAKMAGVPPLFTEQNPKGLGETVADIPVEKDCLFHKQFFDACREDGFTARIPDDAHVIVTGCEAHVCVQQTALGLLAAGRKVYVVSDAIGSRHPDNSRIALGRMAQHGAEIVTTEMVLFEWLQTAEHPHFRQAIALIK